jgi:hypothetical protein
MGDTATNLHVCTLMQVRKNVPCAPFVTEIRVTFAKTGSGQPCGKHRFLFQRGGRCLAERFHHERRGEVQSVVARLRRRCEKRHFLRHLYIKTIILPRLARDKHRESTQNKGAFSLGWMERAAAQPSSLLPGKKTRLLQCHFTLKRSFYQDRLRANTLGKALKKRPVCFLH